MSDLSQATFDAAGSSSEAHRHFTSKQRTREYRARKRMGLCVRPVRLSRKLAQKLVELGYISLDSKGDKRAEAFAIEAYLADSLS
jgi:hypothetical protein